MQDRSHRVEGTNKSRWFAWAGIVLLMTYLLYLYDQVGDLHALHQHELALQARELQAITDNAVTTVKNAESDLCLFVEDQPYLELVKPASCKGQLYDGKFLQNAELELNGGLMVVSKDSSANNRFTFKLRLDRVLGELSFPESYRLVFLAKDTGEVIHRDAPTSRRWRRKLSWHEQNLREPAPGESEDLEIANFQTMLGDHKPAFGQLRAAGARITVPISGVSQEVYLQPIKLGTHIAVLGGVLPSAELYRRALEIDTYAGAALLFLFTAGLVGIPFVKLFSLDKRERYRLRDVLGLHLSAAALLLLGVAAVLTVDGYRAFRQEADRGLKQLADGISARLAAEMRQAVTALQELDKEAARMRGAPACEPKPPFLAWFDSRPVPPPIAEPKRDVYALQVAWVGSNGNQLYKVTADPGGKNVGVSRRVYFKAARSGSLFHLDDVEPAFFMGPSRSITDGKFYTFFSMPSKIKQTGCAKGSDRKDGESLTAVLTARLLSVNRQALPDGYGFAVINRDGAVLYHSDGRLSLRENIFAEAGHAAELKSLVMAGRRGFVATSYRERPHRFYLKPFTELRPAAFEKGEPGASRLFLVTFRDGSAEIATAAQVFMESLGVLLLMIIVWTLSLLLVDLVSRHSPGIDRGGTWLWPQQSMARFYKWFGLSLAALLGLALVLCRVEKEMGEIAVLWSPALVIPAALVSHLATKEAGGARAKLETHWWRRAMWALLIVWFAFAPAIVLFRMSLEHEFGKLIETERTWMAQQSRDAAQQTLNEGAGERLPERVAKRAADLRSGVYQAPPPAPFESSVADVPPGMKRALNEWMEWLGRWLPTHSETAIRLRRQEFEGAAYLPPGFPGPLAWLVLVALFAVANWAVHWNARHLFLAGFQGAKSAVENDDAAAWRKQWEGLPEERQNLIFQISEENLANPRQVETVEELLEKGYLKLDPDLRPRTEVFGRFLRETAAGADRRTALEKWERVPHRHSWIYARKVLISGLVVIAVFLLATQPSLQTGLTAGFGVAASVLAAVIKLRDAIAALLATKALDG